MVKNSWASTNGTWKQEDSKGGTLLVEGDKVSITSTRPGTPFHVFFQCPMDGDAVEAYFELTIPELSSSLSVGLVAPEECKGGWETRGMFNNGNLTNGSKALKTSFGAQPVQEGDGVGVRYVRSQDNHVTVIFYHNGRCLGKGFDLPPREVKHAQYYPCIQVSDGNAEVHFRVPEVLPIATKRENPKYDDAFEGEWKLVEAFDKRKQGMSFDLAKVNHPVVWKILKQQGKQAYNLHIKVGNSFNAFIVPTDPPTKRHARIRIPTPASFRMSVAPHLQPIEDWVAAALPGFLVMEIKENGKLTFDGPSYKAVCESYTPKVSICKYYSD